MPMEKYIDTKYNGRGEYGKPLNGSGYVGHTEGEACISQQSGYGGTSGADEPGKSQVTVDETAYGTTRGECYPINGS